MYNARLYQAPNAVGKWVDGGDRGNGGKGRGNDRGHPQPRHVRQAGGTQAWQRVSQETWRRWERGDGIKTCTCNY